MQRILLQHRPILSVTTTNLFLPDNKVSLICAIAKEAFNRKISLLTSKPNIEIKNKLVRYYVWSIALYGSETWTLTKLQRKYLESFEMWCWRRMEKIK
jgi:hypothetical protein